MFVFCLSLCVRARATVCICLGLFISSLGENRFFKGHVVIENRTYQPTNQKCLKLLRNKCKCLFHHSFCLANSYYSNFFAFPYVKVLFFLLTSVSLFFACVYCIFHCVCLPFLWKNSKQFMERKKSAQYSYSNVNTCKSQIQIVCDSTTAAVVVIFVLLFYQTFNLNICRWYFNFFNITLFSFCCSLPLRPVIPRHLVTISTKAKECVHVYIVFSPSRSLYSDKTLIFETIQFQHTISY